MIKCIKNSEDQLFDKCLNIQNLGGFKNNTICFNNMYTRYNSQKIKSYTNKIHSVKKLNKLNQIFYFEEHIRNDGIKNTYMVYEMFV